MWTQRSNTQPKMIQTKSIVNTKSGKVLARTKNNHIYKEGFLQARALLQGRYS